MDTKPPPPPPSSEDIYEFKSVKETSKSPDPKSANDPNVETSNADLKTDAQSTPQATPQSQDEPQCQKRQFSELTDPQHPQEEQQTDSEESKRKKRKDNSAFPHSTSSTLATAAEALTKDSKTGQTLRGAAGAGSGKAQGKAVPSGKQSSNVTLSAAAKGGAGTCADSRKSPCASPKPSSVASAVGAGAAAGTGASATAGGSDAEVDESKHQDLKVPPLKIVFVTQQNAGEQEAGNSRNGKSSSQRTHQALPYVVASSNSNDSSDKELAGSGTVSPTDGATGRAEDKKEAAGAGEEMLFVFGVLWFWDFGVNLICF